VLDSYKPDSDWFMLEAKLRAYGSDQVLAACLAANAAHAEIISAAQSRDIAVPGEYSIAAFAAVDAALTVGLERDEALIAVVREEIQLMRE